jgi:hypothetical protein
MKMKTLQKILVVTATAGFLTTMGCAMGVGDKSLAGKMKAQANNNDAYGSPEAVFVEIPTGAEIGNSVVPTFKTSAAKTAAALDVSLTSNAIRAQVEQADLNLPEVGTASYFNGPAVFSLTKSALPMCQAMFNNEGGAAGDAIRATYPTGGYKLATYDADLDRYINKLGERLWGRLDLTAAERMHLKTMKNEVVTELKRLAFTDFNIDRGVGVAICTAMALAPDAVIQ